MASTQHVDAVVVGSGFGGSVTAFRLADAGREVLLLERGKPYPPGSFARTPSELARAFWDPSEGLHGLFDIWSFAGLDGIVSAGLGGGSLIYANVLLRKDEKWFVHDAPAGRDGYESWPISRADLEPHYDTVERMLGPQRFPLGAPGYEASGKTEVFRDAAQRLKLDWQLAPLAVTFATEGHAPVPGEAIPTPDYGNLHGRLRTTCRLCGECDIGCNYGAKNTLDHNYLSAAKAKGADIRTRCEVRSITPLANGSWEVGYVEHQASAEGTRTPTAALPVTTVTCDTLVLGAGTFGSTYLLLRNRAALPALSPRIGHRFCGNGDLLGFLLGARDADGRPIALGSTRAPVITSYLRGADTVDGGPGRGFYLEDAGYPGFLDWFIEEGDLSAEIIRGLRFAVDRVTAGWHRDRRTRIGGRIAELLGDGHASGSSTALLGMGRDVPDGTMTLDGDRLELDWTTETSEDYFDRVRDTMHALADTVDGHFVQSPLSHLERVITVHPLGGASMGADPAHGVVNAWGEVFGHPGLFVTDGAAMPGPVGANPSLTIAAFANRTAEHILETRSRRPAGAARPVPEQRVDVPDTSEHAPASAASVAFTEEMKGYVAFGETDPVTGDKAGRRDDTALMFHLTIRMEDIDAFVGDRQHTGAATGWIDCPALGGRLPVTEGVFNLFVAEAPAIRRMLYRLFFTDSTGHDLTLVGHKEVRDDPGLDVWPDTSTLFSRVLQGHVRPADDEAATVVAAGVLHIHLLDFARQLTTFRVDGPSGVDAAGGLMKFGRLFVGELWDVYGPGHAGSPKSAAP